MAALTTGSLSLPDEILDPWLGKVQYGSSIAALSDSIPMKFGQGHSMTFDIGEAEYVAEGANKGASTITPTTVTTKPYKFHKTVRWTEEVKWADEDEKVNVVRQVLDLIQPALSRALDIGVYHGINPTGGGAIAGTTALDSATAQVERVNTDKAYANLDAADALVLANSYLPKDVALSPLLASKFSGLRGATSEQKLYPNLKLDTEVSELDGHRASVSRTVNAGGVSGAPALATQTLGVVGDFNAIRWGIQRAIGMEMIEYGDPDGGGDLKRNNQVAFRAEVVYGWGIADLNAFALIVDKVAG